jgi:hypothetical protein
MKGNIKYININTCINENVSADTNINIKGYNIILNPLGNCLYYPASVVLFVIEVLLYIVFIFCTQRSLSSCCISAISEDGG